MARNRTLWDILAILIGIAIIVGGGFLASYLNSGSYSTITIVASVFLGAMAIGFFAYRKDGLIISIILAIGTAVLGFVGGIIFMSTANEIINSGGSGGIGGAIGAVIGGIFILVLAIMAIIVGIGGAILMSIGALIGRLFNKAVWKSDELEYRNSYSNPPKKAK